MVEWFLALYWHCSMVICLGWGMGFLPCSGILVLWLGWGMGGMVSCPVQYWYYGFMVRHGHGRMGIMPCRCIIQNSGMDLILIWGQLPEPPLKLFDNYTVHEVNYLNHLSSCLITIQCMRSILWSPLPRGLNWPWVDKARVVVRIGSCNMNRFEENRMVSPEFFELWIVTLVWRITTIFRWSLSCKSWIASVE